MQGFLELTQLKELKLASDKLKLKRSLPINGTEAMPEKKLFKVNTNFNVFYERKFFYISQKKN